MEKTGLTESLLDRKNILNNQLAVSEIEKAIGIRGVLFEGIFRFTKKQVADFYEVDSRTIDRYIENNSPELEANGYEVLRSNRLKEFRLALESHFANDINVVNKYLDSKTRTLGIFDFRTFLNIGMLLRESDVAKEVRQVILDIVIDVINQKTGGGTKYINQRDKDFVITYFKSENYRKQFTDVLNECLDMGKFKYPYFTDKIYKSIFREKANEYRKILNLSFNDNVRKTLYSEILLLVSSFEFGFAEKLKEEYEKQKSECLLKGLKFRGLDKFQADECYSNFENQPHWKPLLEDARVKMASRDLCFRDALHLQLQEYLAPLPKEDFEKFLGSSSMDVEKQLEQFHEVFKRLKDRK